MILPLKFIGPDLERFRYLRRLLPGKIEIVAKPVWSVFYRELVVQCGTNAIQFVCKQEYCALEHNKDASVDYLDFLEVGSAVADEGSETSIALFCQSRFTSVEGSRPEETIGKYRFTDHFSDMTFISNTRSILALSGVRISTPRSTVSIRTSVAHEGWLECVSADLDWSGHTLMGVL